MAPRTKSTRRTFLQTTAVGALGATTLPYIIPQTAWGANERVVAGYVGVGGRGMTNLRPLLTSTAAVCDVDQRHLARAAKAIEGKGRKCDTYSDYRKVLEREDIDVVVVSTPDHWHALPTIDACRAGKDVYCEKPLTLTIAEGRKMVDVARETERIVQTGSQQRSFANFRRACELVRNGHIGKLEKILVGLHLTNYAGPPVADTNPPKGFDYDFWLGPAPQRPYNPKRVHYNFRFFWDYSGGQMTNWGAHHIDIAHWGMGVDDSGPLEVDGKATFHPENWYEVTQTCRIEYKYPNDVTMIVCQENTNDDRKREVPRGTRFVGSKGTIYVDRGKLVSDPADIVKESLSDDAIKLYKSDNHMSNFLQCVKTRELPVCDVEIGHRSATACHLGNIACRLGRKLVWDSKAERIVGDDDADTWRSRPYRAPWKLA